MQGLQTLPLCGAAAAAAAATTKRGCEAQKLPVLHMNSRAVYSCSTAPAVAAAAAVSMWAVSLTVLLTKQ
jgi:hypothetical protein